LTHRRQRYSPRARAKRAPKNKSTPPPRPSDTGTPPLPVSNSNGTPPGATARLEAMIEAALEPVREQLASVTERSEAMRETLDRQHLEGILTQAALGAGVHRAAVGDFVGRGLETFRVDNGNLIATDEDGAPVFSERHATRFLSVDEWTDTMRAEAPHLFDLEEG